MGSLFGAVCYFLWQALPLPMLLSAGATEELVYGLAVLATALIGISFGLLTVRWFLHASFSELQLIVESQEPREPPKFRIEPRIGNLVTNSARSKPIPLEPAAASSKRPAIGNGPVRPTTREPKILGGHRSGHARPH